MADGLQFDLVSPERLLISEAVEHVVVPGAEGYLTVLPNHAPLMTTLKPGVLEVKDASGDVRRYFVRGGFADVTPAGLTILADQAIRVEELNASELDQQIREAEEDLADFAEDFERRTAAEKRLNDLRDARRWVLPA